MSNTATIPKPELPGGVTHNDVLKTIRDELQAEHLLIFHRVSWFVASQAFLISAFATAANGKNEGANFFGFAQHALPFLGGALSLLVSIGVGSAITVQLELLELQSRVVTKLRKKTTDLPDGENPLNDYAEITCLNRPSGTLTHWFSIIPPFLVPCLFSLLWLATSFWNLNSTGHGPWTCLVFVLSALMAVIVFIGGLYFVVRWWGRPRLGLPNQSHSSKSNDDVQPS